MAKQDIQHPTMQLCYRIVARKTHSHNQEHPMITSWKRTIAIVCLALFLAATAASFHALK
jgi:hypothetical protein